MKKLQTQRYIILPELKSPFTIRLFVIIQIQDIAGQNSKSETRLQRSVDSDEVTSNCDEWESLPHFWKKRDPEGETPTFKQSWV